MVLVMLTPMVSKEEPIKDKEEDGANGATGSDTSEPTEDDSTLVDLNYFHNYY